MSELEKLSSFKYKLAVAETFEELSFLGSASDAMAEFARKEKLSLDKQNEIGCYRVEVMEKLGEWLDERFPSGGDRKSKNFKVEQHDLVPMPVTKDESSRARLIAHSTPETKQKVVEEIKRKGDVVTPNKVASELRKAEIQARRNGKVIQKIPIPAEGYQVILADPPWQYAFAETSNRAIENHYETGAVEEIQKHVPQTADNCVLFLWATAPKQLWGAGVTIMETNHE